MKNDEVYGIRFDLRDMHADRPGLLPVGYLKGVIEQNKEFMKMTVTGASS